MSKAKLLVMTGCVAALLSGCEDKSKDHAVVKKSRAEATPAKPKQPAARQAKPTAEATAEVAKNARAAEQARAEAHAKHVERHADLAKERVEWVQKHQRWADDDMKAAGGKRDTVHAKVIREHRARLGAQQKTEAAHAKLLAGRNVTEAQFDAVVKEHESMVKAFEQLEAEHAAMLRFHANTVTARK